MKFEIGSEVDKQHCKAIKHEYLRCKDSFERFESVLDNLEEAGHTRELAHKAYNAYSAFILHLYELVLSTQARDFGDTGVLATNNRRKVALKRNDKITEVPLHEALDLLLTGEMTRILNQHIYRAKLAGPQGIEQLEFFNELLPVPDQFSEKFRTMRNKVAGHVTYQRIREIDLSTFYHLYDNYLYVLYVTIGEHWGRQTAEFPDFEQVTDFLSALYSAPHRRS